MYPDKVEVSKYTVAKDSKSPMFGELFYAWFVNNVADLWRRVTVCFH